MNSPTSSKLHTLPTSEEQKALLSLLDRLSQNQKFFIEGFYERFFAELPEVRPLFGEYSLSEQNEMILETFRSILGWIEDAPWLSTNLETLGISHAEYGVKAWMYEPFVDIFISSTADQLTTDSERIGLPCLRNALEVIVEVMIEAGESSPARTSLEDSSPQSTPAETASLSND